MLSEEKRGPRTKPGETLKQKGLSGRAYGEEVTTEFGGNHEIVESWKPRNESQELGSGR